MAEDVTLSVSDAVELAKGQVSRWPSMTVVGEVSGFRGPNARSGHCYFEVKDGGASMSVIVWRGTHQKLSFELRDGLEVQLTGKFDIYKGSGRMSFVASRVEASGEGLLRQRIAELARRLQVEGLMDDRRKRPIPAFCSRVCVVTSLSGSVIEDVKRTLARRNPPPSSAPSVSPRRRAPTPSFSFAVEGPWRTSCASTTSRWRVPSPTAPCPW